MTIEDQQQRTERRRREDLAFKRECEATSVCLHGDADSAAAIVSLERKRFSAALATSDSHHELTNSFEAMGRIVRMLAKERENLQKSFNEVFDRSNDYNAQLRKMRLELDDTQKELRRSQGTVESLRIQREEFLDEIASYREEIREMSTTTKEKDNDHR